MKYQNEKTHPGLETSLRGGEVARGIIVGDPHIEKRDMTAEQRAAFVKPGNVEKRVLDSESDQGLTH